MALLMLFGFAALAAAQVIQFDGRVPAGTPLTAFDADNGLFNPSNVFGAGLKPSQLLLLPVIAPSLFDIATNTVPLEVTIRHASTYSRLPRCPTKRVLEPTANHASQRPIHLCPQRR